MAKYIAAGGAYAERSRVNQAWIVRPHNPNWSKEVRDSAPILCVLNSESEVIDYLCERGGLNNNE